MRLWERRAARKIPAGVWRLRLPSRRLPGFAAEGRKRRGIFLRRISRVKTLSAALLPAVSLTIIYACLFIVYKTFEALIGFIPFFGVFRLIGYAFKGMFNNPARRLNIGHSLQRYKLAHYVAYRSSLDPARL